MGSESMNDTSLSNEADFERDLADAVKPFIMDDDFAKQVWGALANVDWYHMRDKKEYSCSFRYAGGLIAEIRGEGNYMDWYCSAPDGVVSDKIHRLMKKRGWSHDESRGICDAPDCLEYASCGWSEYKGVIRHTCTKHTGKHNPLEEKP